jgi:hypothetical protein
MKLILALAFLLAPVASQAASFYPACLKPDGDWVHGLTPSECRQVHGRWYTADVLKKARKVW